MVERLHPDLTNFPVSVCAGNQDYKMADGKEVCFVNYEADKVFDQPDEAEAWCQSAGYTGLWELRTLADSQTVLNLERCKNKLTLSCMIS